MFRTNQAEQYFRGKYLRKKTDAEGSFFRYRELVERRRTFGTIINNLIADQERYTIATNWDLGFKPSEYIITADNERYIIDEVVKMHDMSEQTYYWLKKNQDTTYVLSLIKVDNVEDLQC